MLIDLDDGLGALDEICAAPEQLHALQCLALAHKEGKHFITGNRKVLDALGRYEALGLPTQAIYRHAARSLSDGHALRGGVHVFVRVVRSLAEQAPRIASVGGQLLFSVPLVEFGDSQRIQAASLLGEHIDDARVYCAAAAAFRKRSAFSRLPLHFDCAHGGGQTTGEILAASAARAMVVCVVDSDKGAPEAPLGSTARGVVLARERVHARRSFMVADAHVLEMCREIENLLPPQLVRDAVAEVPDHRRCVDTAMRLNQLGRADYQDLNQLLARHAGRDGKLDVLDHVAAFVARISPEKLAEYLFQPPVQAHWERLGAVLSAWGCAARRNFVP